MYRSALWIPTKKTLNENDQSISFKPIVQKISPNLTVEEKLQSLTENLAEKIGKKYSCKVDPDDIEATIHVNAWQKDSKKPDSIVPIALVFQYRGCKEKKRLQYNSFDDFFQKFNPVYNAKPTYHSMPNRGHAFAFTSADDITNFSNHFDVHFDNNDLKSQEGPRLKT